METNNTKQSRILSGVVVKAAMKGTVTVLVTRYVKHPRYKKYQKLGKKYLVHNSGDAVEVGQKVNIRETRPISKRKRFVIV